MTSICHPWGDNRLQVIGSPQDFTALCPIPPNWGPRGWLHWIQSCKIAESGQVDCGQLYCIFKRLKLQTASRFLILAVQPTRSSAEITFHPWRSELHHPRLLLHNSNSYKTQIIQCVSQKIIFIICLQDNISFWGVGGFQHYSLNGALENILRTWVALIFFFKASAFQCLRAGRQGESAGLLRQNTRLITALPACLRLFTG